LEIRVDTDVMRTLLVAVSAGYDGVPIPFPKNVLHYFARVIFGSSRRAVTPIKLRTTSQAYTTFTDFTVRVPVILVFKQFNIPQSGDRFKV